MNPSERESRGLSIDEEEMPRLPELNTTLVSEQSALDNFEMDRMSDREQLFLRGNNAKYGTLVRSKLIHSHTYTCCL